MSYTVTADGRRSLCRGHVWHRVESSFKLLCDMYVPCAQRRHCFVAST
jgi:hypothetical protein